MSAKSVSRRRILIPTFGSLGDLHPFLAIALELKSRGHEPIIATGECYRQKIHSLGLGFHPIRPDCDCISDPDFMRPLMHPRWGILRVTRFMLESLEQTYADLLPAVREADLLVSSVAVCAGRLAAEKTGTPWASVMHIPTGLYSACDPPLIPGFPGISRRLRFLGPAFWGPAGVILKWATHPLAGKLTRFRRELGLPKARELNSLTEAHSPALHLATFSKHLVDKQPDWPPQTVVTGFPWYPDEAPMPDELLRFLDSGPPPVVFTLGSAVSSNAGEFYKHSAEAAHRLGLRAVLLFRHARNQLAELPPGVVAFDYAPFSQLFPRAAVTVHHGGIGTTGLGMKSGRPMLVVPFAWDQPDNAERVRRLGIARTLNPNRYTVDRITAELRRLLDDPAYVQNAADLASRVQRESGAETAADALEQLLISGTRRDALGTRNADPITSPASR